MEVAPLITSPARRRLLVFPRGNPQASRPRPVPNLALYLDAPEAPYTPPTMTPKATFTLVLVNHNETQALWAALEAAAEWGELPAVPLACCDAAAAAAKCSARCRSWCSANR